MERTMSQRLVAEFVGAFALVFIGAGAFMATAVGGGGPLAVALAYGLAVAVMVSAVGHVSGGHFNPAVTAGVWIAQKIKSSDAVAYMAVQLAGAAAGAALLRVALPKVVWSQQFSGVPNVTPGISNGQAVLIEAILTFFLVWVVFATTVDSEGSFGKIAGLGVGLAIVASVLFAGNITGAALNPARHFGPGLVFGQWNSWWVYWIGPIAGGIVAAALYDGVIMRRREAIAVDLETGEVAVEEIHGVGPHGDGDHTVQ